MMERFSHNFTQKRRAWYSEDQRYRYLLEIIWDELLSPAMFIGLNPSTATELENDPTVTRCERFARDWGCGSLIMTNLFAARSTDPMVMKTWLDPVGPENTVGFLVEQARRARYVIAAWGKDGGWRGRDRVVTEGVHHLDCLRISEKTGKPWHPLYLPGTLRPIPFNYGGPDAQ